MSRIALSIGCPSGIGPEVAVVAAARAGANRLLLVGDLGTLERAATLRGVDRARLVSVRTPAEAWSLAKGRIAVWQPGASLAEAASRPGRPTKRGGAAQLQWIDAACDLVARKGADALVTGPVSKDVVASSGVPGAEEFTGHTEHLQRRLGAKSVVMAFWSARLTVSLVSTHLPLEDVPAAITPDAVLQATSWLARLLARLGKRPARIVVAALNPHAGEGGLLGHQEKTCILPGIRRARSRLAREALPVEIDGPLGAETAFRLAHRGRYDGVVSMYHDQATIPMKLIAFGDAVNVSLGLPIVRTSVDHGTAYDVAGTGKADARGLVEAVRLAAKLNVRSSTGRAR